MEVYCIKNDIEVFGKQVTYFPQGVDDAFNRLTEIGEKGKRVYYGIAYCTDNKTIYSATVNEVFCGEADAYDAYDVYTIEAGDYLCVPVYEWKSKTASIKNIFENILKDESAETAKPTIEKYVNDNEMLCLVKLKAGEDVISLVNKKAEQLTAVFATANSSTINHALNSKSWSPAQVLNHLTKSNVSIAKAMSFEGSKASRPVDKRVAELREMFLDYSVKYKTPQFILPEEGWYDLQLCRKAFQHSVTILNEAATGAQLTEAISHPAFGEITKLELLHFVVFHSQRHLRQLKKILAALQQTTF